MKTLPLVAGLCTALGAAMAALSAEPLRCERWEAAYADADATGEDVIGLWAFDGDAPEADVSGRGYSGRLEGASLTADGRFGAALQSAPGWPVEDKPHRLMVANDPRLTPKGAFTLELWLNPGEPIGGDYPEAFLLDKKYVDHADYQWVLGAPDRDGKRVMRTSLGFGDDSQAYSSTPLKLQPGTWVHLAFTYNGAGEGRFWLDGCPWGGQTVPARGAVVPGRHGLAIGDRIGSYYHGVPGRIDQVRITRGVREFRRVAIDAQPGRRVFRRMEPGAILRLTVTNLQQEAAEVSLSLDGAVIREVPVGPLPPGKPVTIEQALPTDLRPDEYRVRCTAIVRQPVVCTIREAFPYRIVPRPTPDRMPVLMWGGYGNATREIERLKRIGFTHVLGLGADYEKIWKATEPTDPDTPERVAANRAALDAALAADLTLVASLSPGSAMRDRQDLLRVGRDGNPYAGGEDVCALDPRLVAFCNRVGVSMAQAYGDHPAFGAALLHTEVRDHARPCFHEHDREAFRKATGREIPAEVAGPRGVDHSAIADFPADRVIPDDHPLYVYYRWYWKEGDGWNGLNTALARGLKSAQRADLWTFHDPAARVASVLGSGGEVDVLSQWTYSYPDPIRIGLATDELLAYARGSAAPQQVMKMTQIIWYRSQTAPEPKPGQPVPDYQASWEREQPDAPFITIAPMHLREAFWTKIARPIQGIMYHGWQSLVPCDDTGGYRYTHPDTQHELARLIGEVVEPLGPMLRRVPGSRSDVAMLKCFAAEVFARRGTFGWGGGWAGDAWHVLNYVHLQTDIVLEETLASGGLDGYRVLVLPDCDVLTRSVADRIRQFQAGGGIVVADERLAPAIRPDIVLPVVARTGRADQDKAALQAAAVKLREALDTRYARYVDTSNPDVIPYCRRAGTTDYVFLVNDRREYGHYVGQHGIVMENGLPTEAEVRIARPAGWIYDLVEHQPLQATAGEGQLRLTVPLSPCGGRALMVTDRAIAGVTLTCPGETTPGAALPLELAVTDAAGQPLDATVPVQLAIRDPSGRLAEGSGAYAAVEGRLKVTLDIAPNDQPGVWEIEARELASGNVAYRAFHVAGPQPWPPAARPLSPALANPVQPKG